jgi:hypothetical protein
VPSLGGERDLLPLAGDFLPPFLKKWGERFFFADFDFEAETILPCPFSFKSPLVRPPDVCFFLFVQTR